METFEAQSQVTDIRVMSQIWLKTFLNLPICVTRKTQSKTLGLLYLEDPLRLRMYLRMNLIFISTAFYLLTL